MCCRTNPHDQQKDMSQILGLTMIRNNSSRGNSYIFSEGFKDFQFCTAHDQTIMHKTGLNNRGCSSGEVRCA